jgi:hypothetical protein
MRWSKNGSCNSIEYSGIIINEVEGFNKVGEYDTHWNMPSFKPYDGEVIIKNDTED